jgi:hypothetical protein
MKDFGVTSELPTIATGRTLRCVLQSSGILRFTASVTNLFCLVRREGAKPVMRASERAHWKRLGHRRRTPVSLAAHASCTEEQRLSSQQRAPSRSRSAAMHRLMRLVTLPTYTHTHTDTDTDTDTQTDVRAIWNSCCNLHRSYAPKLEHLLTVYDNSFCGRLSDDSNSSIQCSAVRYADVFCRSSSIVSSRGMFK